MVTNKLPWRECYDCMDVVHSPVVDSVLPQTCTVWGVRCEENMRNWCAALAAFLVVTVNGITFMSMYVCACMCVNASLHVAVLNK